MTTQAIAEAETPDLRAARVHHLVTDRAALKAQIEALDTRKAALEKEVRAINEKILAFGPGEYRGANESRVLVISPKPAVQLPPTAEKANKAIAAEIKEIIGDDAAFKKLFWFVGGYVLCKNFRIVAAATLTPARLEKVLKRLETPGLPYVR